MHTVYGRHVDALQKQRLAAALSCHLLLHWVFGAAAHTPAVPPKGLHPFMQCPPASVSSAGLNDWSCLMSLKSGTCSRSGKQCETGCQPLIAVT